MNHITRSRSFAAVALAAIALLFAAPAFAGGPLATCQSGQAFLWPNGGSLIPFNPDQGDLGPLTNAAAVALTQDAFDQWGAVPSSSVSYVDAGFLPVDVDITNFGPYLNAPAPDGLSAIVFDDDGQIFDLLFGPGSGVLGFAGPEWVNPTTCEILEGLSFLNGPAFTNSTAAFDVMVHEFGHYTNLAHTVVNGQLFLGDESGPTPNDTFAPNPALGDDVVETMYPFYFGPGSGTATLHPDDVAILSTLYPDPGFFSSTGSISGTIRRPNGAPVTGVNVIARNVANPFNDAVSAISGDFTVNPGADPLDGTYTLNNLTPGADYALYVDEILQGGFSTPPLAQLPGPEEFWNGVDESNDGATDDPAVFTPITASAGAPVSGIDVIFNAPPPGVIDLGDDDTEQLSLPFVFEFCGQQWSDVFVNSNGSLTFGAGDTDFSESAAEMLADPPRIAGLWDDLNPSAGGTVSFSQSQNRFTVTFDQVPEFFATGANTFSITLRRASDQIDIDYGSLSATDGLAGISCGGAVTSGFEDETVLRTVPNRRTINAQGQTAIFEQFTAADNDLSGYSIRFTNVSSFADVFESNDTLATATPITLPFDTADSSRFSALDPAGADVDFYSFSVEANQFFAIEVVRGALDSVIGLFDANSGALLILDDDGGDGLLSRLVLQAAVDLDLVLAVSAFPDFGFTGVGGSGGRYVLYVNAYDGVAVPAGDDTATPLAIGGFSFPFQGQSYNSLFVNSNGNLTFGAGSTDFSESVFDFLNGPPRIAPLWDDLNPSTGLIVADEQAGSLTVHYVSVPEFFSSSPNYFSASLDASGAVDFSWGPTARSDGLVGVTEGNGAANPGSTDLSAGGQSVNGTTYQQFSSFGGDVFDLFFASVTFSP